MTLANKLSHAFVGIMAVVGAYLVVSQPIDLGRLPQAQQIERVR